MSRKWMVEHIVNEKIKFVSGSVTVFNQCSIRSASENVSKLVML